MEKIPATLGIDTRARLLAFHRKYYSAPLMTLCVLGKEPLPQLQKMAEALFSAVPSKETADPSLQWWGKVAPFREMLPSQKMTVPVLEVVPISEGTTYLSISW